MGVGVSFFVFLAEIATRASFFLRCPSRAFFPLPPRISIPSLHGGLAETTYLATVAARAEANPPAESRRARRRLVTSSQSTISASNVRGGLGERSRSGCGTPSATRLRRRQRRSVRGLCFGWGNAREEWREREREREVMRDRGDDDEEEKGFCLFSSLFLSFSDPIHSITHRAAAEQQGTCVHVCV